MEGGIKRASLNFVPAVPGATAVQEGTPLGRCRWLPLALPSEAAGEASSGFVARFLAQAHISWRAARQETVRRRSLVRKDLCSARPTRSFTRKSSALLPT